MIKKHNTSKIIKNKQINTTKIIKLSFEYPFTSTELKIK